MNRKDLLITLLIVNCTVRVFFSCLKGHNKKSEIKNMFKFSFSFLKGSTLGKKRADNILTHRNETSSAIHHQKVKHI